MSLLYNMLIKNSQGIVLILILWNLWRQETFIYFIRRETFTLFSYKCIIYDYIRY